MFFGLFAINLNSGFSMTTVKERWRASPQDIIKLVKYADDKVDFILPAARWLGFKGKTDPSSLCYENLSFSSYLLGLTKKIKFYSTIHIPLFHPTYIARAVSTIDQFAPNRLGLNIVCGWYPNEFKMFDINSEINKERYLQGAEWIKLLKCIIENKRIPFKGEYYKTKFSITNPTTINKKLPEIMNAGFSKEGKEFALKYCDILFSIPSESNLANSHFKKIKKKVYVPCHVVLRSSDQEAEKYYDYYANKKADLEAIYNFSNTMSIKSPSVGMVQKQFIKKMAGGTASYPLIGSADTIIDKIKLLEKSGINGIALSFVDYSIEFSDFYNKVIKKYKLIKN